MLNGNLQIREGGEKFYRQKQLLERKDTSFLELSRLNLRYCTINRMPKEGCGIVGVR